MIFQIFLWVYHLSIHTGRSTTGWYDTCWTETACNARCFRPASPQRGGAGGSQRRGSVASPVRIGADGTSAEILCSLQGASGSNLRRFRRSAFTHFPVFEIVSAQRFAGSRSDGTAATKSRWPVHPSQASGGAGSFPAPPYIIIKTSWYMSLFIVIKQGNG